MGHDSTVPEGEFVGEASHGRGRLVAVATVLTTLAAATTGYMQAAALRVHDEADVRAERLAALALNVAAANRDQALVQVDRYRILRQEQMQGKQAEAAARRDHGQTSLLEAHRWAVLARITAFDTSAIAQRQELQVGCSATSAECNHRGFTAICSVKTEASACGVGRYNQASEWVLTARYEQAAQWEAYRLDAEREATDAQADGAHARFGHLAAALTMLTVAVFLFGYSLTPQGQERRKLFLTCATFFLLAGVVWSLSHALQGYPQVPASAARAFADGRVAFEDGMVSSDKSDFEAAVKQFTWATKLWPGSSGAYSGLANAEYALSFPQGSPYFVPPVRVLQKAIADDERAREDGSESPTVTHDLGGELLFLGLQVNNNDDILLARKLSQDAASRFVKQRSPGTYLIDSVFSVAEADLALGVTVAKREYCKAMGKMVALQDVVPLESVDIAAHADMQLIVRERPQHRLEGARILKEIDKVASTGIAPHCDTGAT